MPSESWQLPVQHSVSDVQFAATGAHVLHRPPLHIPETAPGWAQHCSLSVHAVELFTGMHAEHTPFAQNEQADGHCNETLQD